MRLEGGEKRNKATVATAILKNAPNTLPPRMALTDETISRGNAFATIATGIQIARG
jgi:hypothetical protein